jgi:membrane-associated phospholipid phosphatase
LFSCYWLSLLVFALYPTVGPFTYFAESFRREWQDTATYGLMQKILAEFLAVKSSRPVNGFGYFVALPSLHAAAAVILQASWRHRPVHFWSFLPVNLAMCASTVLLGYHYLIDLPAGVALAGLVLGVHRLIGLHSNAAVSGPSPQP